MLIEDIDDQLDSGVQLLVACDEAIAAGCHPAPVLLPTDRIGRGIAAMQALRRLKKSDAPTRVNKEARTLSTTSDEGTPKCLGRFQIIREIGRGGFGVVFQAFDPKLKRDIALKLPHASALLDDQLRERFRREARAAAGLDHPNIVPVFEVDE